MLNILNSYYKIETLHNSRVTRGELEYSLLQHLALQYLVQLDQVFVGQHSLCVAKSAYSK